MSAAQRSSSTPNAVNSTKSYTRHATKALTELLKTVQVSYLEGLVNVAIRVVQASDEVKVHQEECKALSERIQLFTVAILLACGDKDEAFLGATLKRDVEQLGETIASVDKFVTALTASSWGKRLLKKEEILNSIRHYNALLDGAFQAFQLQSHIDIRLAQQEADRRSAKQNEDLAERLSQHRTELISHMDKSHDVLLKALQDVSLRASPAPPEPPIPPFRRPPPKPQIFSGRDKEVELIIGTITNNQPACIAVLGPPGIGKTTVALAVFYDKRVISLFKARYFIRCDGVTSAAGITGLISDALRLPRSTDPRTTVLEYIEQSEESLFLVADNLESTWDTDDRTNVEELLTELTAIETVTLLVTLRGSEHPLGPRWTTPRLPPLAPLALSSAREMFIAISGNEISDEEKSDLNQLLRALDCVPLAVLLMASIRDYQTSPTQLLRRWEAEHTAMLTRRGDRRLNNLDYSIQLSLESPSMREEPTALSLLSIISLLPDGVLPGKLERIAPHLLHQLKARDKLIQTSLAYDMGGTLRVLSPIRDFITSAYPPEASHLQGIQYYYMELVNFGRKLFSSTGSGVAEALTPEFGNILALLLNMLSSQPPSEQIMRSVLVTAQFSRQAHIGDCEQLLRRALQVAIDSQEVIIARAECTEYLANIFKERHSYDEAMTLARQAEALHIEGGNYAGAAHPRRLMANILYVQGRLDEALLVLKDLQGFYEHTSDEFGEGQVLLQLGKTLQERGQLDEARTVLERATLIFRRIDHLAAQAECILCLGNLYRIRALLEEAVPYFEEAAILFDKTADPVGQAYCKLALGDIQRAVSGSREGVVVLEEAKALFIKAKNMRGEGQCLRSIADALRVQARFDEASITVEEARALFQRIKFNGGVAQCRLIMGWIRLGQENYEEAGSALEEARVLFQQAQDRFGLADCTRSLGQVYYLQSRREEARSAFEEAMSIFKEMGNGPKAAFCQYALDNIDIQSAGAEVPGNADATARV